VAVLGFEIAVRLPQGLLEDFEVEVTQAFYVDAHSAGCVFAELTEKCCMASGAVHEVNRQFAFAWVKSECVIVAFAAAVILVVITIKADRADVPEFGLAAADLPHHIYERAGVFNCLFVVERCDVLVD